MATALKVMPGLAVLELLCPISTFLGQKYQTGRNSAGSIFLDLCNFDLDLWDFLFGFVGLIKLLRRGGGY